MTRTPAAPKVTFGSVLSSWWLPLAASATLVPAMWTKAIIDHDGGDVLGSAAADLAAWILLCGLKLLVLMLVPVAIARAARRGCTDLRGVLRCAGTWAVAGIAVLAAVSYLRTHISAVLNNEVMKFYPTAPITSASPAFVPEQVTEFVQRWHSGTIWLQEASLISATALGLGAAGYFLNRRPLLTVACGAWMAAALLGGNAAFHLARLDFDDFMSGTLIGPLFFDLFYFFAASDAATPVASFAYAGLIWSSYLLSRQRSALDARAEAQ